LAIRERQEQAQQQERLLQQFQKLQENSKPRDGLRNEDSAANPSPQQQEDNLLLARTQTRLESLYRPGESPPTSEDGEISSQTAMIDIEEAKEKTAVIASGASEHSSPLRTTNQSSSPSSNDDTVDDWTRDRIRRVIEARSRNKFLQQEQDKISRRKDLPPIEDNAVFLKYKNGSLVNEESPYYAMQQEQAKRPLLPPYPSREHFIGIWRAVTPPTGFPEETGEATKSDNLILRVDGTTAGGPILDNELQQKAAGGTWRLLESDGDDGGMRLRIRLVIPPKKERILVMEGDVTRVCMTPSELPLATSTFAIPELEARLEKSKEETDDMLHCGGEVRRMV
jgi:hypothetical protein